METEPSSTPNFLNADRVRNLRDRITGGLMRVDKMYDAGTIVALCDQFLRQIDAGSTNSTAK